MLPEVFANKDKESFDQWADDLRWYLNQCWPGLREVFLEIDKLPVDASCDVLDVQKFGSPAGALVQGINVVQWSTEVYGVLRKYTAQNRLQHHRSRWLERLQST